MTRISLDELERRCQKPDHRRIGNWMARRFSRPAALRITWLIAPWGISANAATLAAWGCGLAAAAALGWGSVRGWIVAAGLLHLWYLLDHVDGQLARLRSTASLDGVQLDFLMHHTVNLLVPLGAGWGLAVRSLEPLWLLAGVLWGVAQLLITLQHDARYKAFYSRLKRVRGVLLLRGGGGGRPQPQPPMPPRPVRWLAWAARKACEAHVMISVLGLLALGSWLLGDRDLWAGRCYLALMAPVSTAVAGWVIVAANRSQQAEREFAAWHQPPPDCQLLFADGWWMIEPAEKGQNAQIASIGQDASPESS
jgi:phosphatidylglycerophosphate synthase